MSTPLPPSDKNWNPFSKVSLKRQFHWFGAGVVAEVGSCDGNWDGGPLCAALLGAIEGVRLGPIEGTREGPVDAVGVGDASSLGFWLGPLDGSRDGAELGSIDGARLGVPGETGACAIGTEIMLGLDDKDGTVLGTLDGKP